MPHRKVKKASNYEAINITFKLCNGALSDKVLGLDIS